MNYARARLQEATAPTPSGKDKQVRPPGLLAQTGTTGPHGDSRSSSPSSKAVSARSSAYRAVHEAAKARKALLDAQAGVKQAASQLFERKARCDREHQAIVEEIEAVQSELRTSTERQMQGQEVQAARKDAMGYQMAEMKDLMAQREVRMEAQIQEVCSQLQAMGTMLKNVQPRSAPPNSTIKELLQDTDLSLPKPVKSVSLQPKESIITTTKPSVSKQHLARYAPLPQPLVSNGEAVSTSTKLILPASTKFVPPTTASHEKEPTCEAITIETSSMAITGLREPIRTNELTNITSTFQTANATLGESNTELQTADTGLPPGNPCASSTRRREVIISENTDDSINSTRGSSIPPPAIIEEAPISPEQLRFTEAISKAMSKELAPLIANRDQTRVRPTIFKGTKDGTVDGWLPVMKRFLERVHAKSPNIDKAWAIIDHLEGEARNYIINKSEPERDTPDKVFALLASRFGTGGNRMHVRQTFMLSVQQEKEDWMQFLDALEGLRTQGFPDEPITTRRYEILQRFIDGVNDPTLQQELAVVYAAETYLTEPPTVESLRFATRQLQRHRPTTSKPYDPRYAMRSRPHPFVPGKLVHPAPGLPQNVLPPNPGQHEVKPQMAPPALASVQQASAPQQPARMVPLGACFNCGLPGHFARECPNRDLARKPAARAAPNERVNLCENNVASACSGPVFCVNCGMTEHSASQCQNVPIHEDLAYSLWAEQPPAPQTMSDSEMVLMLRPAEAVHVATTLTITCGKIQIQANPEPTTFDPSGRTIMSVRLLLAIERETRPGLTIDALIEAMTTNEIYRQLALPQPEEWQVKGVTSTYHAYSPVPVKVCIDGVDMRFGATVITDAFPPGICLGPRELRCYKIDAQEPSGEARIDERASLVVSFTVPDDAPVQLPGLIDTGSGVSILTFLAYNRIAVRTGTFLRPYNIDLYAANGKTIRTFGLAEKIKFQLGGYELENNFVVVDDAMGVEDFLLGRNFLRAYQVLMDLTAMKIIVRSPSEPVWYHAHAQVSDESLNSSVATAEDVILQPFERAILRAKLLASNLEPFRTVLINFQTPNRMLKNAIFLEDTVATVGETGFLYVSLGNLTSNVQRIKKGTLLGTAIPVTMVHKAIPQIVPTQVTETQSSANYVCKVYEQMNLDSSSEYSSSSEFEFLSSTDPSELGLSKREIKKRTDPALMAPIPGPEAQLDEVRSLWGPAASDTLNKLLKEFDDLFMK